MGSRVLLLALMDITKSITLKHIVIAGKRYIGLQFYPDKVIQALVKGISGVGWSNEYNIVVVPNHKVNLDTIFRVFKGVAWVNTQYFFTNRPINTGNLPLSVDSYRHRSTSEKWRCCPEEYYQKLEIRKYSLNTARIYISMFERFINHYKSTADLMSIGELEIKAYLQKLVKENRSNSYINQSVNAIKFYYEVVKGMPNRFYSIERPQKGEKLPEVLSMGQVL